MKKLLLAAVATALVLMGGTAHADHGCTVHANEPSCSFVADGPTSATGYVSTTASGGWEVWVERYNEELEEWEKVVLASGPTGLTGQANGVSVASLPGETVNVDILPGGTGGGTAGILTVGVLH